MHSTNQSNVKHHCTRATWSDLLPPLSGHLHHLSGGVRWTGRGRENRKWTHSVAIPNSCPHEIAQAPKWDRLLKGPADPTGNSCL